MSHRELILNPQRTEVTVCDHKVNLTKKEFQLLEYLLRHKNQISSRTAVSEYLWGGEYLFTPQQNAMLDVTVSRLRKKISTITNGDGYIATINKQGYKLS